MKNNIHNRSEDDIRKAIGEWAPTPPSYTVLDYKCLFDSADDTEEISDVEEEKEEKGDLDAVSDEDHMYGNAERSNDDEFSDMDGDENLMNEVRFSNFLLHTIR